VKGKYENEILRHQFHYFCDMHSNFLNKI